MNILVTGGAGFIGSALAKRLFEMGHKVTVVDNFNDYYDVTLKRDRVRNLIPLVPIYVLDITNKEALGALFEAEKFDVVCHLAAQAGVRHSIERPDEYVHTNVLGTQCLLETMKKYGVKRMVFASTSSAYGDSSVVPFKETDAADRPVSIYAATKRAGELIGHTYAHLHGMDITCLRFFTVYGPWGRPDMALFKFTDAMLKGEAIEVYNNGDHRRDFTYIGDIVAGFVKAVEKALRGYEIINLGNGDSIPLLRFIEILEHELDTTSKRRMLPMQEGDVFETFADIEKARTLLAFEPQTNLEEGVKNFVAWYRDFYKK